MSPAVSTQSHELHEQALDFRSATVRARAHETNIAWPTIVLCVIVVAGFWTTAWLAASGALSLWWAVPINALLAYAAYTPAHEAVHGNVHRIPGRAQSEGTWLNNVVGALASSALLHNFPMHQLSHLAHHAHTNDPARDPDHWMAVRGLHRVLFKAFSLIGAHYFAELRLCIARRSDGKRRIIMGVMQNMLWLSLVALLAVAYDPWAALAATVLSAWLGSAILAWAFDWLPHVPHTSRERFFDTRVTLFPVAVNGLLTRLFLFQNYHHIHHLWPRIPFHRYQRVHQELEDFLAAQGVAIDRWGDSTPLARPQIAPLSDR
jgi:beta-carotene hydroxylase